MRVFSARTIRVYCAVQTSCMHAVDVSIIYTYQGCVGRGRLVEGLLTFHAYGCVRLSSTRIGRLHEIKLTRLSMLH